METFIDSETGNFKKTEILQNIDIDFPEDSKKELNLNKRKEVELDFPEDGDEGYAGFHQSPRHQEAHAIDVFTIALTYFFRFAGDIESAGGA